MLCTQKDTYQAQNNYLVPVTMLASKFETKCVHEQLTEHSLSLEPGEKTGEAMKIIQKKSKEKNHILFHHQVFHP